METVKFNQGDYMSMRLAQFKKKKETADWLWDFIFERVKNKEATQIEIFMAMSLCNDVENEISLLEWREYRDKNSKHDPSLQKYFNGFAWYRPDDCKLFISNGEKFISQTLPYEAISFEQMDKLVR